MTIEQRITKSKELAAKATIYYGAYKQAEKYAKLGAEHAAHVWEVRETYADDKYDAAVEVATTRRRMGGVRLRTKHASGSENFFDSKKWALLSGFGGPVQARQVDPSTEIIQFRAWRKSDLAALQSAVVEVEERIEAERGDIDVDFEAPRQNTTIFAWDGDDKSWSTVKQRPARTFTSVVVPADLQADIQADLTRFTDSRKRLDRLEMPWRRGYMLAGPPGTGKTSLALAIAGTLKFRLASFSLSGIKSDDELKRAIRSVPERTVLVIEDIDANPVSHQRTDEVAPEGNITLSGLLNSLDGFETPEGMVTILTTNHIERLDEALVRSGRMDRTFHLGHIAGPELERLFTWFYEQAPPTPAPAGTHDAGISPADMAETFRQHLDDPASGWAGALQRIADASTGATIHQIKEAAA